MSEIESVSYVGRPVSHTAMFITKKVEYLLENLKQAEGCLVFAEDTIEVPKELAKRHTFVMTKTPQREYAQFVIELAKKREALSRSRKYTLTEGGYYLGENVSIGENTYIEPGAFIGHDVVIGKNSVIKTGAKIKNTITGDGLIAGENCVIGTASFTIAEDEDGNKFRMPSFGRLVIGNNVEIGASSDVACGSAGDTVLEDNVKLSSFVLVGHDSLLCKNVELHAGTIIGGFDVLEEGAYVGMNATLRNRIHLGKGTIVGMGAVVTKSVEAGVTVVGNPARPLIKNK